MDMHYYALEHALSLKLALQIEYRALNFGESCKRNSGMRALLVGNLNGKIRACMRDFRLQDSQKAL